MDFKDAMGFLRLLRHYAEKYDKIVVTSLAAAPSAFYSVCHNHLFLYGGHVRTDHHQILKIKVIRHFKKINHDSMTILIKLFMTNFGQVKSELVVISVLLQKKDKTFIHFSLWLDSLLWLCNGASEFPQWFMSSYATGIQPRGLHAWVLVGICISSQYKSK